MGGSPGGRREPERQPGKDKERERGREKVRERETDGSRSVDGPGTSDNDEFYHRVRAREQMGQEQVWSRFAPPRTPGVQGTVIVDDGRERGLRMMEMERERERERYMRAEEARARERERERFAEAEEARRRELEWEREKAERFAQGSRAPPKEKVSREKERERDERRPGKSAGIREEYFDERERFMREGDGAWVMDTERARERNERVQRERSDLESMQSTHVMRQGPPQQLHPHHHDHHHHHHIAPAGPLQSHTLKPSKHSSTMPSAMQPGIGPGMGSGDGQMPFEQERQQLSGPPQYGPGPPKMTGQGPPVPSHYISPPHGHSQQHAQVSHPYSANHVHQPPPSHVHSMHGQPPPGYQQRRTPPPELSGQVAPAMIYMPPRSPSPRYIYAQPPVHLGTFVYPRTPFPYLDFPGPEPETGPLERRASREVRATILIPSGFLPSTRPKRPRIWGGALIPALLPLPPAEQQFYHPYIPRVRPLPHEIRGMRRVYTDDSDLFLCVLHAGLATWSEIRRAKSEGQDLRVEVRITKEARFIGGFGSSYIKTTGPMGMLLDTDPEDDGSKLLSAGWGNSHDGAGIEILSANLVERGMAHSSGPRNRNQRLSEYNERRAVLCDCSTSPAKKRRRTMTPSLHEDIDSPLIVHVGIADSDLSTTRTITFGDGPLWSRMRFKAASPVADEASSTESSMEVETSKDITETAKRKQSQTPTVDEPRPLEPIDLEFEPPPPTTSVATENFDPTPAAPSGKPINESAASSQAPDPPPVPVPLSVDPSNGPSSE